MKNLYPSSNLSSENFSKLSIYSYGYTAICFTNSNKSLLIFFYKYLNSLFDKSLTNASKLEFMNCMLSIQNKLLLIAKAMSFSNPFSITLTFTSNLPISHMMK